MVTDYFFLEPLQALSLYYTCYFAELISTYLEEKCLEKFDQINYLYNLEMWSYQISLAYHYQYGSIYDTEFWNKKQNEASNVMRASFNGNPDIFMMNLERDSRSKKTSYSKIGCFARSDLEQIHFGMLS